MLVFIATLLLFGCDRNKDRSEDIALIYQLLDKRKQAVAQKDIHLYRSVFLENYDDLGLSSEDLVMEMQQVFSTYEQPDLAYPHTRPHIKMNSARIIHTAVYSLAKDKPKISTQEMLLFRKVNDIWYISGGMKLGLLK